MRTDCFYVLIVLVFNLSCTFCQEIQMNKILVEGKLSYVLENNNRIYRVDNSTEIGQSHSVVYIKGANGLKQQIEACFKKVFSSERARLLSKQVGKMTCYFRFNTFDRNLVTVQFYMWNNYQYVTLKELNDLDIEFRKLPWYSFLDIQEDSPMQKGYYLISKGTLFSTLYD